MIIDSSVIVAVALNEPERAAFETCMAAADIRRMSSGTWIELSAVAVRSRLISSTWLDTMLERFRITLEAVSIEQAAIGHQAYREFGQGSGHPAKLNFGDCFAYALAKAMGEPLLFKGDDFTHTDVQQAI